MSLIVENYGLPQNLGNLESLEKLQVNGSGLKELPESLCSLKKLKILIVQDCANLQRLPQNLGNLKSLEELFVDLPSSSCNLPQSIWNLESLKELNVVGSCMKEVPSYINNMREFVKLSFFGCNGLILPPLTGDFIHLWNVDLTNCGISEFPIGLCYVTSLTCLALGGNIFESIPESIEHLSHLESIDLSYCKKLKYLPESIKWLPAEGCIDFRECTSLDRNQRSKILNHLTMENLEDKREYYLRIRCPGSEVVEKMKHRNELGSSLTFSFQLLEDVEYALQFYACLVLDRAMYNVKCKGNFVDESGLSFGVEAYTTIRAGEPIQSKHVFVETIRFRTKKFVKGRKYSAELQFLCLITKPDNCDEYGEHIGFGNYSNDEDRDIDDFWSRDGTIKCGVFPLFDHQTVQTMD